MTQLAIDLFVKVVEAAIPFATVFAIGQLIVNTFLRAAFGGRLEFRV